MFYYMQLIAFRSVHVDSHTCSVSCISLTFLFFSLFRSHDKWNRMKRGDEGKIQDGEEDLSSYRTACNISEEMIWLRTPKTEIAVYARKLPPFAPNKCNWNSFWYEGLCKLNQNLHPVFTLVITVITIFLSGRGRSVIHGFLALLLFSRPLPLLDEQWSEEGALARACWERASVAVGVE